MAKVQIILWKYQANKDGSYPLRLRIYKDGKKTYKSTSFSLHENQWNSIKREVKPSVPRRVL